MATIATLPPGVAVEFATSGGSQFGTAGTSTIGLVGLFDHGTVAACGNLTDLINKFGARVNYSRTIDDAGVIFGEGATEIVASRVVGPGAAVSTLTLQSTDQTPVDSLRVDALSAGEWGDDIKVTVAVPATLTVTLGSVSEQFVGTDKADLVSQVTDPTYGSTLITVTDLDASKDLAAKSATSLASGDDDRANITVTEWQAALAAIDSRYGPMTVTASGATDTDIQKAVLQHCDDLGRECLLENVLGADSSTLTAQASALAGDTAQFGGLFGNWAYTNAVPGDPQRLVPWSVVQAGITARVDDQQGPAVSPFGPTNGAASTVTRLHEQFTDADRNTLYEANVNVATDDGTTFSTWGYRTLDSTPINNDLQQMHVRMAIKFEALKLAASYIGKPADQRTAASYAGRLDALGKEWVSNEALLAYGTPVVTVDSVNRQLHGTLPVYPSGSIDWVDLIIPTIPLS